LKLRDRRKSEFSVPAVNGNPAVDFKIQMNFMIVENIPTADDPRPAKIAKSFRKCLVCGQETVSGGFSPIPCKLAVIKKVMEA